MITVSAEVYQRHYLGLVRLARQLVDDVDSAEDVVQDVFAAVAGKALPADPLPYLRTAVVNRSRSLLRRRSVARRFVGRAHRLEDAAPADVDAFVADRRSRVLAAIDALPRRQREVVVLRYYADLRVAEIAETLGVTSAAVSTSLARALENLGNLKETDRD